MLVGNANQITKTKWILTVNTNYGTCQWVISDSAAALYSQHITCMFGHKLILGSVGTAVWCVVCLRLGVWWLMCMMTYVFEPGTRQNVLKIEMVQTDANRERMSHLAHLPISGTVLLLLAPKHLFCYLLSHPTSNKTYYKNIRKCHSSCWAASIPSVSVVDIWQKHRYTHWLKVLAAKEAQPYFHCDWQ